MSKDIKKGSLDLGDLVYDGGELRIDFEAFNDWHRRFLKRFFDGVDASSGDTPDHFEKLYFEKVKQTLFSTATAKMTVGFLQFQISKKRGNVVLATVAKSLVGTFLIP